MATLADQRGLAHVPVSARQRTRAQRIRQHHANRYAAAAGDPAKTRDAAFDELRSVIRELARDAQDAENEALTAYLRERTTELRKKR